MPADEIEHGDIDLPRARHGKLEDGVVGKWVGLGLPHLDDKLAGGKVRWCEGGEYQQDAQNERNT
jgi:hypothetical protein